MEYLNKNLIYIIKSILRINSGVIYELFTIVKILNNLIT